MRATVVSLALAGAALWAVTWGAFGCGSPGGSSGPRSLAATRSVFLGDGQVIHARCLAYDMDPVPATFAAFEAEIRAWIERARGLVPELKTREAFPADLTALLRHYHPNGGWTHKTAAVEAQSKDVLELLRALGRRGSFIAELRTHFVVVDGVDSTGHVLIRDPWYEPGRQRGIHAGSRYRVFLPVFFNYEFAAVFRP